MRHHLCLVHCNSMPELLSLSLASQSLYQKDQNREPRHSPESDECQNLQLQTLALEFTKTSITETTSALSAPTKSTATRKSGHAERVGLSSIYLASRNGHLPKAQPWLAHKLRMDPCRHQGNGVVQAAIYQKIICHRPSPVGVRRKQNQDLYPVFHHSVAVRLALVATCYQNSARIHAQIYVMLDLASLAHRWVLNRAVFVVVNLSHAVVSIRITKMAGHVAKSAESSCHVVSTFATGLVTKACVELVKSRSRLDVIVGR